MSEVQGKYSADTFPLKFWGRNRGGSELIVPVYKKKKKERNPLSLNLCLIFIKLRLSWKMSVLQSFTSGIHDGNPSLSHI